VDLSNNDYKRYADTPNGISPYVVPWTVNWEFIATSYEHGEYGESSEDPEMKSKMMAKRSRKMKTFIDTEFNDNFYWYEIINPNAEKFYVSFGFNRYVLEDCIKWDSNTGLIIITVFQPLDPRLKKWFTDHENQIKELTFVEMNENWSLEKLIKNECNLRSENRENKINHIRKFNLYPIFKEDLK
jgi:2-oxoglutarate ferredoxin oxidoreductase subunit alpha